MKNEYVNKMMIRRYNLFTLNFLDSNCKKSECSRFFHNQLLIAINNIDKIKIILKIKYYTIL